MHRFAKFSAIKHLKFDIFPQREAQVRGISTEGGLVPSDPSFDVAQDMLCVCGRFPTFESASHLDPVSRAFQ